MSVNVCNADISGGLPQTAKVPQKYRKMRLICNYYNFTAKVPQTAKYINLPKNGFTGIQEQPQEMGIYP